MGSKFCDWGVPHVLWWPWLLSQQCFTGYLCWVHTNLHIWGREYCHDAADCKVITQKKTAHTLSDKHKPTHLCYCCCSTAILLLFYNFPIVRGMLLRWDHVKKWQLLIHKWHQILWYSIYLNKTYMVLVRKTHLFCSPLNANAQNAWGKNMSDTVYLPTPAWRYDKSSSSIFSRFPAVFVVPPSSLRVCDADTWWRAIDRRK